ncbi:MAG: S41 family peptidase [Cyanobacteria bacterium P01_A01_bin.68]
MKIKSIAKNTTSIALSALAIAAILIPEHITMAQKPEQKVSLFKDSPKEIVDEVWQIVYRQYIDGNFNGQDWQAVRREYMTRSYSSKQKAYTAISEMLDKLGDPFTRFLNPKKFKAMKSPETVGLTVKTDYKAKELVVVSPAEETPAYKAGILSGDVLVKIDNKTTQGMNPTNVLDRLRGEVGTPVILTIRRGQKQLEFRILREKIELRPVSYEVRKTKKGNIGYIRLKEFNANASREMQQAIRDLEKKQVTGYILDLRSNSGGLLSSSIEVARMWLNKGTIMSTIDRKGTEQREEASGRSLTDKPLIIIINDATASGAEILSAALQENNRAILIGTKTNGYNTIQSVRTLNDGSGLAVTITKWLTPKERDINNLGISPDMVVNLTSSQQLAMIQNRSFGTMADPQFSKAVQQLIQLIQKK